MAVAKNFTYTHDVYIEINLLQGISYSVPILSAVAFIISSTISDNTKTNLLLLIFILVD